ncbi:hypothetical protein [Croceicoccus hydrothermalis]|uniref:hypothetical protein n=1 Tax=Croceicoccus hydrothermalis TaxID=2867964 RepID=UPI001EFBD378|nr:hypothetical protein [Croceicoccus hydrothermalis]
MGLAHFQLTLNAHPRSVLRLLQITEYDFLRLHASSEDAVVSQDLAKVLVDAFPGHDAETAFAKIFGETSPGWEVREGSGTTIIIETGCGYGICRLLVRIHDLSLLQQAFRQPVRSNLTSGRRSCAAAPQSRLRRVWLRKTGPTFLSAIEANGDRRSV